MDLVKILKDTPLPVTLYSTVFGELKLFTVLPNDTYPLHCATMDGSRIRTFSSEGKYDPDGECVLFPSKENRDWSMFAPFKDGDIVTGNTGQPFIFKSCDLRSDSVQSYCGLDICDRFHLDSDGWISARDIRLATKEEKQRLFDAIKANGYKWNAEEKKVDKVEKPKFDPSTLKPFDKVLMRDCLNERWGTGFFSYIYDGPDRYPFNVGGFGYRYCIPFNKETAHLVSTTQAPPEYYDIRCI